jgi:osmotically-inducible protein OsmY
VKTALSLSKRIPADHIDVDSENDVVTLYVTGAGQ